MHRSARATGVTLGDLGLFLVMSVIWGATWIAVKAGVSVVPPILFAGLRYGLAALVLVIMVRDWTGPFRRDFAGRTVVSALLVNAATYALLFWGIQFVDSGVAGLINLSLVPVGLFALSILFGDERPSWRHGIALGLGATGLAVLLVGDTALIRTAVELLGAAAVVAGTLAYCFGTMLSRPLLAVFTPLQVTAAQALVGAVALAAVSAAIEPPPTAAVRALSTPAPLASLLFLALFGTIITYTIYLRLVSKWGPSKAGLYPFISPIIALALGWFVYAEPIGWRQAVGAIAMLSAAMLALPRPANRSTT